jgi:hypothetical protein
LSPPKKIKLHWVYLIQRRVNGPLVPLVILSPYIFTTAATNHRAVRYPFGTYEAFSNLADVTALQIGAYADVLMLLYLDHGVLPTFRALQKAVWYRVMLVIERFQTLREFRQLLIIKI